MRRLQRPWPCVLCERPHLLREQRLESLLPPLRFLVLLLHLPLQLASPRRSPSRCAETDRRLRRLRRRSASVVSLLRRRPRMAKVPSSRHLLRRLDAALTPMEKKKRPFFADPLRHGRKGRAARRSSLRRRKHKETPRAAALFLLSPRPVSRKPLRRRVGRGS